MALVRQMAGQGESIVDLGWAGDGALLAAGEKHWRITGEPGTRTARRSAPLSPRPEDIVAAGPGSSRLQRISYDGAGRRVGVRDLPLEVGGTMAGTVSNIEGWSAASVFLGRSVGEELGAYQGAYAVQIDMSPRPRLLTPPVSCRDAGGRCRGATRPGPGRDRALSVSRSRPVARGR